MFSLKKLDLILVISLVSIISVFCPSSPLVQAETYVAGQFGVSFPKNLSDVNITSAGFTAIGISDIALDDSFIYGLKVGHYFRSLTWLGLESDVLVTHPNIKQQNLTFTGPGGSFALPDVAGFNFRVVTFSPITILFRYPGKRLQPYAGAGLSISIGRLRDKLSGDSQTSTKLGFNTQAGLRLYLVRHWAIFAEGKYSGLIRFQFKETANLDGFDADYSAFNIVGGIGYHW